MKLKVETVKVDSPNILKSDQIAWFGASIIKIST
jgi:hypothetical protein